MLNKIKQIKQLRLSKADKFFFDIIYNLKEEQTLSNIVKYFYKKKLMFEYDISTNTLYMDFKTFEEFEYLFTKKYTEFILDSRNYFVKKLEEYFTYDVVKRDSYEMLVNKILIEDGKMERNPLFNSISGKCIKLENFAPIIVDNE